MTSLAIYLYFNVVVLYSVNNKLRILTLYISLKGGGCVNLNVVYL